MQVPGSCEKKSHHFNRSKPAEMVLAAQKAAGDTINLFKPIEVFMPWTPVGTSPQTAQQILLC